MAERSFTVDIVTPERVVLSDRAVYLSAPGACGSFGVMVNHAPMLAELGVGELRFRTEDRHETRLAIGGGFLQVFNNQVTVLADSAERPEEIDVERARRALEVAQAEQRRSLTTFDKESHLQTERAVERAQNRIRIGTS